MSYVKPPMLESEFWKSVKAGFSKFPEIHFSRIENSAGSGMSDVSLCRDGVECWIELKMVKGNSLYFRDAQRIWIAARIKAGSRVLVLARKEMTVMLWNAASMLSAEYKHLGADKKSFRISIDDMHPLLFKCDVPVDWIRLVDEIFGGN